MIIVVGTGLQRAAVPPGDGDFEVGEAFTRLLPGTA